MLFFVLCLIKLVMLVEFRKHLFEIHWRVTGYPPSSFDSILFYGFALLVGLTLWRFGEHCNNIGPRTIRPANACVLAISFCFIILTFHEGDKNWLSPILHGILKWQDLGSYFALNLFFRPPYLAIWLIGYAGLYYGLLRWKREHRVLRLTAVFATVYICLCLREFIGYRKPLVIVNCIGWACLFASIGTRTPLKKKWMALPFIWGALIFVLFAGFPPLFASPGPSPEFLILMGSAFGLFLGATAMALKRAYFNAWTWLLPFAATAFLLFIDANYHNANNYNEVICLGFSIPRYFLGEMLVAGVILLLGFGYLIWRPQGSIRWLDILNLLIITTTLLDLRFSQITGARLDWRALSWGLGETPTMMWRMARPYLPVVCIVLILIGLIYFAIFKAIQRTGISSRNVEANVFTSNTRFVCLAFILLGVGGKFAVEQDKVEAQGSLLLAETSPWFHRAGDSALNQKAYVETARSLGMTQLLAPRRSEISAPSPRDWNVILIFQESTYNKYLSLFGAKEETQPLLAKYKDRMEIFPHFFSNFAGSINARFATFTGLYPVQDYKAFTLHRIETKSLFEILGQQGYQTSMFYSSSFDYTGFRDFLRGRGINEMYDADSLPGERKTPPVSWGVREEETLSAMQEQIKKYATQNRKFFLTYIPAAPHNPFDGVPASFDKFPLQKVGDLTPRYLNELLYMDWIISSIIDQLKSSGVLDKTLVVITSDHGEMLGRDGPIGHGWAVTPELANIPLIVMKPGNLSFRVNDSIGSQVDLLPTILDLLNIPIPANGLLQGDSLYKGTAGSNRTIYLNSFQQYGVIRGTNLLCGERGRSGGQNFAIGNLGSLTTFTEVTNEFDWAGSISKFDKFQESLLANFSQYREFANPTNKLSTRAKLP